MLASNSNLANIYVAWHGQEYSRLQAAGLLKTCLTRALIFLAACKRLVTWICTSLGACPTYMQPEAKNVAE